MSDPEYASMLKQIKMPSLESGGIDSVEEVHAIREAAELRLGKKLISTITLETCLHYSVPKSGKAFHYDLQEKV